MIEGSQIDWGGHDMDSDYIISETLDFDNAIKEVLAFAKSDKNTLVYIPRYDLPSPESTFTIYPETVQDVYKYIFEKDYIPNFKWAGGKWISVSKDKIRKTPLHIYKRMLHFVLKKHNGQEPSQGIYRTRGIYIERFILNCFL